MIPKTLHCCWFGGGSMPPEAKRYIEGWKKLNPGYELKIWNEKNIDVNVNRYAAEALAARKWAFVTDYVRLKVLYDYGGIYMDTDVEVVRPLDPLLAYHAFSGFEGLDRINTGTMGSEKGNPWIGLMLRDYDVRRFVLEDGSFDITTNVATITRLTVDHYPLHLNNTLQNLGDFTILPFDYLCAKDLDTGEIRATQNTFTIHHFAGSWLPPKKRIIKKIGEVFGSEAVKSLVSLKHRLEGRRE